MTLAACIAIALIGLFCACFVLVIALCRVAADIEDRLSERDRVMYVTDPDPTLALWARDVLADERIGAQG